MGTITFIGWSLIVCNLLVLCGFVYAWPRIRHKRSYIVAMVILCLGPAPLIYFYIPLILVLPVHLAFFPSSILQIVHFVLPSCIPLGVIAWYGASRYLDEPHRRGFAVSVVVGLLVAFGLLIGKSKFAMALAGWSLPMAAVYFTWPWLRTRHIYTAIAAALCLTTGAVNPYFWPFILTIFDDIMAGSYVHIIISGLPMGVMTWVFFHRLSREEKYQPAPLPVESKAKSKRKAPSIFAIAVTGIVLAAILFDHFVALRVPSIITKDAIEKMYGKKFDEVVALIDITDSDERERKAQELEQFFHADEAVLEVQLYYWFRDENDNTNNKGFFDFDRYEWGRNIFCSTPARPSIRRCHWDGSRLIGESEEKCIQPSGRHICPWDRDEVNRKDIIWFGRRVPQTGKALTYETSFESGGMIFKANFALKPLTAKLRAQKYADHLVLKHFY